MNLDYLIKKGKAPKPDTEYIYLHDIAWKRADGFNASPLAYGTVVVEVVQRKNNSYDFKVKETGEEFRTNYGWSFLENTEEGRAAKARIDTVAAEIKRLRTEAHQLYQQHTLS